MDILNTKIVSRNDISSNWTQANPILLLGEIGVETDTNKLKVGNGVNNWNDLPYMMGDSGKSNIIIVENFGDLPETGESDIIYKINSTQMLYIWNNLKNMYDRLNSDS